MHPQFTWDLLTDLQQLFEFSFMVHAIIAGTVVAITGGVIGWFVVLRRAAFAAHTLAVVGFPGASGAVLLGLPATLGYFAFCGGAAAAMSRLARSDNGVPRDDPPVVGTVQAFALACGFLFVSLAHSNLSSAQTLLFGTFLGITTGEVVALVLGGVAVLAAMAAIARPLLFASIDPEIAVARGVPTRRLSTVFVVLLGLATAEASQITGSLLVFALLILPAAAATRLTARPAHSIAIAVVIGLLVTWLGLITSYYGNYPIGFTVTTYAFSVFVLVHARHALGHGLRVAAAR